MLLLLNKPYGVLCQFTDAGGRPTLAGLVDVPAVYPAGRLDFDSEGLVLLTDEGPLQARIASPAHALGKTYLVQVEGAVDADAAACLMAGVTLRDGPARAVHAGVVDAPALWPRTPPIRVRRHIPDHWLEIVLDEGRNRQVRRMTAAVGLPTLRLVRMAVGPLRVDGLAPGAWRPATPAERAALDALSATAPPARRTPPAGRRVPPSRRHPSARPGARSRPRR